MIHHLKIYPEHFSAACTGVKRAELRKNDRDFKVGDTLHLMETPKGSCSPTGEYINAVVTHIADVGEWLPGYVMLSIKREPGYAAPLLPQPTVDQKAVESLATDLMKRIDKITGERHSVATLSSLRVSIVEACCAAMLQGAEPVSMDYTLPLDYLQGQKDGLEWAARMAEANHPQTGDWLYDDPLELAKAIRKGPDMPAEPMHGWIPCSERMPETMVSVLATGDWFDYAVTAWSGKEWLDFDDYEPPVTYWMPLPAAPQQEVK